VPNELQLSDVLSEFARTMVTDFPIQGILDRLVERIIEVLPVSGAGVTVISVGARPHDVAASDATAMQFEKLQAELGEGPGLEAYLTGEAVAVADLDDERRFPTFARRALAEGLAAVFTFPLRHGDSQLGALDLYRGTPGPLDAAAMGAAQTLADVAAAYLLNARARSDLLEASVRSRESSLHDPLTGLPNRVLFLERLEHAVLRSRGTGRMVAVLFADLDRFKAVNDAHGHRVGDELLIAVAQRLAGALRPGDTLGRMSGDEFVILCEDLGETSEADLIAARVGARLDLPFVLDDAEIALTASVGIAFSGYGYGDHLPEQILDGADTAMYLAKRNGGGHRLLDLREHHPADHRSSLTEDLSWAVSKGQLRLVHQPIVGTGDGRIVGVEALLRWAHPTMGTISPTTFVPVAERNGLIRDIGRWALIRACADRSRWMARRSPEPLGLYVNVSVHQLMAPNFVTTVAAVLADTGTEARAVTLEVTESAFIQDGARALVVLGALKDLGVSLALDDFGTGYSSLSHLNRFPIDVVKVDQSFVADLATNRTTRAIVAAVIDLSHTLGMTVIGEGVETAEQQELLATLGCDSCQGFHLARPMSADDMDGTIRAWVPGSVPGTPPFAASP
jgi:diguanylate cyclase (GGDEF)-like protein